TLPYGTPLQLTVGAKGLTGTPVLEQHLSAQPWAPLALPASAADGSYAVSASPTQTTWFRLTVGKASTTVRVNVAPVVTLDAPLAAAFTPNDPLAPRQWYLTQIRAFDVWAEQPTLTPVKVAVIDSGIDAGHPEFQGRIVAGKTFVGGDWRTDEQGHGTFVAGEIAAGLNNGQGIAGIAFPAQLLIGKVVRPDGSIPPDAGAQGSRW